MGEIQGGVLAPTPAPVCRERPIVLEFLSPSFEGLSFLVRWQGLLCLRDARLDKAQTSGAAWVPHVYLEERMRLEAQAARVLRAVICSSA